MLSQQDFSIGALTQLCKRLKLVIMAVWVEALTRQDLQVPPVLHGLVEEVDEALLRW